MPLTIVMTSSVKTLSIDIETYSSIDLNNCGVYKYVEAPDFEILLFGYSLDGGKTQVIDLANGGVIPPDIMKLLRDDAVIKWAFNAAFERICLSRHLGLTTGQYLNPKAWRCSMVWSAYLGLPLALKNVASVLNLKAQKLDEGKQLIKFFCSPNKLTKRTTHVRNYPYHDPLKWRDFVRYNERDVDVEVAIKARLANYPVPEAVWVEYRHDQLINDRGVKVDAAFVDQCIAMDNKATSELKLAMQSMTELENPNSAVQVKMWLKKFGIDTNDLGKKNVAALKDEFKGGIVGQVMGLRQMLAKTSTSKYLRMKESICGDGRIRGMFAFYGANRTGRFSSRIVQLQNLPQNHISDLHVPRELVRQGDYASIKLLYENVPDTLSQLIRTAFIPEAGKKFIVADFSAIEARVIAWLSNEQWRLEAFRKGEDIYCASAAKMFNVPVIKDGINGHLRQKGKIAELALGYGGSVGALEAMGALEMGIDWEELPNLVKVWRGTNTMITKLWWDVDAAVRRVINGRNGATTTTHGLRFTYRSGMLFIRLPSGRELAYVKPAMGVNKFGSEAVTYEGVDSITKKWARIESYGPKFVENIVQGIARDLLTNAINNLQDSAIVMHIHDEIVVECAEITKVDTIVGRMATVPSWARDLDLKAEGYECQFYLKM